jgi:hypothetical protein
VKAVSDGVFGSDWCACQLLLSVNSFERRGDFDDDDDIIPGAKWKAG